MHIVSEHIPCGCFMSTMWTFHGMENNHDVYKSKDCMKKFCKSLKERAMKITKFEKKKMIMKGDCA